MNTNLTLPLSKTGEYPVGSPEFFRYTRRKLKLTRAELADRLQISRRSIENWEQGRRKPNPAAAVLILLVREDPSILQRLNSLPEIDG